MIRKLFLCTAFLVMSGSVSAFAQSQQSAATAPTPIFIKPYTQGGNTYSNPVPTIVRPAPTRPVANNAQARSRAAATLANNRRSQNTNSGYQLVALKNPYEGSSYARLRKEKQYYDAVSKRYMGQYEYMKTLSDRGDTAKLNNIRNYVQQNGVFDPQKYKIAMEGGDPSALAQGSAGQTAKGGGTVGTTEDGRKRIIVQKDSGASDTPQRLHQGYDEQPAAAPAPSANRPIFLR